MKTAKEMIVEQAKRLFNEKGYYQVTMRDIAKAANTTIGNLTYHFPRKEDLVLEIQKDANNRILHDIEIRLEQRETHRFSLKELFDTFVLKEKNEQNFSYYFKNLLELGRDYPEIQKKQEYIRSIFLDYFYTTFLVLRSEEVLRKDITDEQYRSLAQTLVLLMTVWNQNNSPAHDTLLQQTNYIQTCSNLIYSFLTEKGQKEYKQYLLEHAER
ncbi:TetR/AcrR family transcriptional regulator [Candidatus Enterococcus mansonii]|uniref:HTH tetR-type domain-containing protein n=1 Tax=Candidatus Enterococcus mansonii TaxID=1834181 RepID=A0A242C6N3_9ENTE|nr:TetR/AcrR family transcriptional regulator [Enterococcus sp. 4G2_DIV0659]OTO05836.1 hypothetical protein A5880_003011 [Enterococcus sp. 4G2_DIV0659]